MIMDSKDAMKAIQKKIDSREWWLIVASSAQSQDMASAMEREFYSGEANIDFEVFLCPIQGLPFLALYFARKTRLRIKELAKFLERDIKDFQGQDIIITPDTPVFVLEWLCKNFKG